MSAQVVIQLSAVCASEEELELQLIPFRTLGQAVTMGTWLWFSIKDFDLTLGEYLCKIVISLSLVVQLKVICVVPKPSLVGTKVMCSTGLASHRNLVKAKK